MTLATARGIAERIRDLLAPYCRRIEVAGSVRREKPQDIKDIELVCVLDTAQLLRFVSLVRSLPVLKGKPDGKYIRFLHDGECVDLFIVTRETWGCIYFIRTGSADFCKAIMVRAQNHGLKFHEGRLYEVRGNGATSWLHLIPTPEEEDVFAALGLQFIPPAERAPSTISSFAIDKAATPV
jgi:DNA polymerase/3'-5' exonuclease PolX